MSRKAASHRYSRLFCTHITSFSLIRKSEASCAWRPEAVFNAYNRTNELPACRRYSCLILQSHHHISNNGPRHTSMASQRRITSHSPYRRCMSQGARTSTMNLLLTNIFPISEFTNNSRIIPLQNQRFPNQTLAPSQDTYKRRVYCTCVRSVRGRRRSG